MTRINAPKFSSVVFALLSLACQDPRQTESYALQNGDFSVLKEDPQLLDPVVEAKVEDLLSKMSLWEKAEQCRPNSMFTTASNERLKIPGFIHSDGPRGVRYEKATSFPVSMAVAATWDTDLIERVGAALGAEMRARGKNSVLAPSIDVVRDPRAGRTQEAVGEDPFLAARYAVAAVRGVQSSGAIATIKHFILNTKEADRMSNNDSIDERGLIEHYGLPFKKAIQEGGARSVMAAYTGINGQYVAENRSILTDILRKQWGYAYYVVSDWGAVRDGLSAIKAGTDLDAEVNDWPKPYAGLEQWVNNGSLPKAQLEEATRRILRAKVASGFMGGQRTFPPEVINSPAHQKIALEAAQKSLVLLKNQDAILPLAETIRVALIGPNANSDRNLLGDNGSSEVVPFYTINVKEGIEEILGPGKVDFFEACDIECRSTQNFAEAKRRAAAADVVIYVGGLNYTQEGEGYVAGDRHGGSINLPGNQQKLINELAAANKNVVVVLVGGGSLGINSAIGQIKGLLMSWYPGQEGGRAIAQALFGRVNPSGKLPLTFPKNDAQMPAWNDDHSRDIVEGRGYRWYDKQNLEPEFVFGHGLSYTSFAYSDLQLAKPSETKSVEVSVTITNTGARAGDEVAQLYVQDKEASVPMPVKQLKGFVRVSLQPGEAKRVTFSLSAEDLAFYDVKSKAFVVESGEFNLMVGGSSRNLPLQESFYWGE